jgi:hypothetical protein
MTSRFRAVVATFFAVFALAITVAPATAAPIAAHPDCFRPCHF